MTSSSFVVSFVGNFDVLKSQISKLTDANIQKLNEQTALIKNSPIDIEELNYLKGNEYDYDTKIIDVQLHTEASLEENAPVNSGRLIYSQQVVREDSDKSNPTQNVEFAIQDAVLNSKSPLSSEDPFKYIISKPFLIFSTLSASLIVFVATLF